MTVITKPLGSDKKPGGDKVPLVVPVNAEVINESFIVLCRKSFIVFVDNNIVINYVELLFSVHVFRYVCGLHAL
jgi:hypothetical protein